MEDDEPEDDADTVCAALHCARTGATPNGRPLDQQGAGFKGLVRVAGMAMSHQARANVTVFEQLCTALGGTMAALGGGR